MIYQHPLAYLVAMEGRALLRAWAGDNGYDQQFVKDRLAEVRRLLDDRELGEHPGVLVEPGATGAAYAQWAAGYDDAGNGLFDLDEPALEAIVQSLPVGTAVDAACGTGRLTDRLVARGHRVLGVDSSTEMLERARRRLPAVPFVAGDLHRLPVPDGAADLLVTGLALTHVADLGPVFAEFARVLRSRGDLLVSDVHDQLVLLGSVVKAEGADGRAQLASTHRHSVAEVLRSALAAGFTVLRFDELPRSAPPEGPVPKATRGIDGWRTWPWTLMGLVPEATRAAWDSPAVTVWHLRNN